MITTNELRQIEERIIGYLDERRHTKTRLHAGKIAAMALARFAAVVAIEETRLRLGKVGTDPQLPLPFEGEPAKEAQA